MGFRHKADGAALRAALFLLALPACALLAACGDHDTPGGSQLTTEKLELVTASGTRTLDVEIARTPEQQMIGLMYRTSLADDRGMLFPHDPPREASMWMRNTYIPLDMVFINADGTVHRIEARTEPFSEKIIPSNGVVAGVLEIAGGAAERLGLKAGDKVVHPLFGHDRR